MFRSISESMGKPLPTGTLGLSVDSASPLLKAFVQETHTTPAWYHVLKVAHCEPSCVPAVVQMIDNTERCARLNLLWQEDGVTFLTARLWEDADDCSVRAFAVSLLEALA